jgi:hypothetical protein
MNPLLDFARQTIADQAWCRSWRRQLLADHIRELEDLEHNVETALMSHAANADIRDAVLHLRELLDRANALWAQHELDYADDACERIEREIIDLRGTARGLGVVQ